MKKNFLSAPLREPSTELCIYNHIFLHQVCFPVYLGYAIPTLKDYCCCSVTKWCPTLWLHVGLWWQLNKKSCHCHLCVPICKSACAQHDLRKSFWTTDREMILSVCGGRRLQGWELMPGSEWMLRTDGRPSFTSLLSASLYFLLPPGLQSKRAPWFSSLHSYF